MKIERMTKGNWGRVKAFFDVKIQGIIIKGFKLIEGINGNFVGVPSIKKEDDSYDNIVIIDKDVMVDLQDIANKYYEQN
jgi:DNA-binding cell septation regulator SpoVG